MNLYFEMFTESYVIVCKLISILCGYVKNSFIIILFLSPSDGDGRTRRGDGRTARASDQAQVPSLHEARADRDATHGAQVQQEHGRGGARQPQVQVRDREDHRHRDHAQAAQRAAAAQGGRRHLLK